MKPAIAAGFAILGAKQTLWLPHGFFAIPVNDIDAVNHFAVVPWPEPDLKAKYNDGECWELVSRGLLALGRSNSESAPWKTFLPSMEQWPK